MSQRLSPECYFACRAIKSVREHSRGPVGIAAREYLLRVERRLLEASCAAGFAAPEEWACARAYDREAAE